LKPLLTAGWARDSLPKTESIVKGGFNILLIKLNEKVIIMTVKELIAILSQLDETKLITVYNCEYDCTDYIDYVKVDPVDGDVVLS